MHRGGLGKSGLHLSALRVKIPRVEPHQQLTRRDTVALMDRDCGYRPHQLGAEGGESHRFGGAGRVEGVDDDCVGHCHPGTAQRKSFRRGRRRLRAARDEQECRQDRADYGNQPPHINSPEQ